MDQPRVETAGGIRSLWRFLPLAVLALGLGGFFVFDLDRYLTFAALHEHREWLVARAESNEVAAACAFAALYALVVAFSIPGGAALTLLGGFLFGTALAAAYVVVAGTVGAVGVFLAARTALAKILRAKAGPAMRRMEAGFRANALSYLLVLRLIPIFPFWLVNLVPAFLGVPLRTYVLGTFIGIIPGTLVYAGLGAGLGTILDAGETPDLRIIFEPQILLPILALAVMAILPVIYRKMKARRLEGG